MKTKEYDLIIVGAGLSGLSLAYYLKDKVKGILILEARERLGGRIFTLNPNGEKSSLEMGATWFSHQHRYLHDLIMQLGVAKFEQSYTGKALFESMSFTKPQVFDMPTQTEPTYRVLGGTDQLIFQLFNHVKNDIDISLNTTVDLIHETETGLQINTQKGVFESKRVVLCVPPALCVPLLESISSIPKETLDVMRHTHTWMYDAIKFGLIAKEPLWSNRGFSGTFYSQVGPITEMYDHTNFDKSFYSLKGFLSPTMSRYTSMQREEMVRKQIETAIPFFTNEDFIYQDMNWGKEGLTAKQGMNKLLPHQNNGNPKLKNSIIKGKLWLGASETASSNPGYMDGAVERAFELANLII